ncbi:proactivator polypeptide-like 1 [Canna indica]|uniref:Pulmonary surfactant-associated protein B n=1 Tax=Canna indica TaxID=4628 RepID=A0AAQ3Q299_9LILI|nr:proactivator polypeptide-like 1 [Canna indica]
MYQVAMDSRLSFLLFMLVISCISTNARSLASLDASVMGVDNEKASENNIGLNEKLCTLCEEFTSQTIYYINENQTQAQIMSTLHKACSRMHSFKKQCITMVDYYAPIFFLEVSTIKPEQFCKKVNLCEESALVNLLKRDDTCNFCHNVIEEVISKLDDPDTELEVIQILLKACNRIENYAQKCKKLVIQYGPLILANAEKFLEATDICTSIHACMKSQEANIELVLTDA